MHGDVAGHALAVDSEALIVDERVGEAEKERTKEELTSLGVSSFIFQLPRSEFLEIESEF